MGKIEELIKKIIKEQYAIPAASSTHVGGPSPAYKNGYNQASEKITGYLKELPIHQPKITELQAWKKIAEMTDTDEPTFNPADFYHDMRILFKNADLSVPVRGDKTLYDNGYRIVHESSLPPQQDKVVVPEFVAEWIEHVKSLHWGIVDLFSPEASSHSVTPLVEEWITKENAERLARAWLDGYTVEKEQLYYVMLTENLILLENIGNKASSVKYDTGTKYHDEYAYKGKFTENEIKAIDERYWAFAVPVEEDE
ncbi:hypothetical protein A5881_002951 [Enterococcus termitis]|nr:hypothetical protein A5881_002394 [Enterococcus termitis]